ncbi:MAG: hypothetical protein ACI9MR_004145 [Myxococcota bacterium]|jgi:hypothetical protein
MAHSGCCALFALGSGPGAGAADATTPAPDSELHDSGETDAAHGAACVEAVHTVCAAHICFDSGLPQATLWSRARPAAVPVYITCVVADILTTNYTALAALEPGCDADSPSPDNACDVAIQRLCQANGAVSGSGPISVDGEVMNVRSFEAGTELNVPWSALLPLGCLPITRPSGSCRAEVQRQCRSSLASAGTGPEGYAGEGDATLMCSP